MLHPDAVRLIDGLRRAGRSFDGVAAELAKRGLPQEHASRVLEAYSAVTDEHGRRRDGVNPGDPGDPVWGK